jgi:hypothetical protein
MPYNYTKTASWTDKEVLKYATVLPPIKSVVLDATDFSVTNLSIRNYVPAGTILKLSVTNTTQYVEYKGVGEIKGILRKPVDLVASVTEADPSGAMYFFGCVFATTAIVGFTTYASALVADLGNYNKFE